MLKTLLANTVVALRDIFTIDGVYKVILDKQSIAVEISEDPSYNWNLIKQEVLVYLKNYLEKTYPEEDSSSDTIPYATGHAKVDYDTKTKLDSQIIDKILELLDTRVRSIIQRDGGDVFFKVNLVN